MDEKRLFDILAFEAIRSGKVKPKAIQTIVRYGTRKEGYWSRHLLDLVWWCEFCGATELEHYEEAKRVANERIGHNPSP